MSLLDTLRPAPDLRVLVVAGGGGIGAAIVRTVVQTGGFAVLHDVKADGAAGAVFGAAVRLNR